MSQLGGTRARFLNPWSELGGVFLNFNLEGGPPPLLNLKPILNIFDSRIMMGTSDEHGKSTSVYIPSLSLPHPPRRILHSKSQKIWQFSQLHWYFTS
jgi:hypothetical protein